MKLRVATRMDGVERTLIRRIFDAAPPDAINLGLGQPDLPTPPPIAEAGVEAIRQGKTGYTSTAGAPELRSAIARAYEPFASGPENVVVTVGSQEAMYAACLALVDAGDEILIPEPAYPAYPVIARLIGATATPYPLRADRGFRIDPEDIERRIGPRTRAVILLSPSNPTGACNSGPDVERLVRVLEDRGIAWLSDEIYSGFDYDGRFFSPSAVSRDGGLVISSLSKTLAMTGWRVGWAVGPSEIVGRIVAAHQYLVTCTCSIAQYAAVHAFSDEGRAAAAGYLEIFRRRRELMAEELGRIPGIRFEMPEGAFYFFVDVSAHGDSAEISRRLLERRGVVIIPGEAFGDRGRGFVRISFAADEESIRTGVRALALELAALAAR